MVSSAATSVAEYLDELTESDRAVVSYLRELFLEQLPKGLEEVMNWGMITYQVPFSTVPKTYNNQPLAFAAIARQKNYFSIYLMSVYADESLREKFEAEYKATKKPMNIGKACIRFKKLSDLPVEIIQRYLKAMSVEQYVERYSALQSLRKQTKR